MTVLDVRLRTGQPDHPKTTKLIRACGEGAYRCLVRLWCRTREFKPDGVLTNWDSDDVEIAAGWTGAPGEFCQALLRLGWLDKLDVGDFVVHDWEEHNGWSCGSEKRSRAAKAAAKARWAKAGVGSDADAMRSHSEGTADAMRKTENRYAPSPSPSPSPIPSPTPIPVPKKKSAPKGAPPVINPIVDIWEHYLTHHPRTKNTTITSRSAEWRMIRDRLGEGFAPEQLRTAIDNHHNDPFHRGQNERKKSYLRIGLALDSASRVNGWLEADAIPLEFRGTAPSTPGQEFLATMGALDEKRRQNASSGVSGSTINIQGEPDDRR